MGEILQLLQGGSDAATILIALVLWNHDRRILILEINPQKKGTENVTT